VTTSSNLRDSLTSDARAFFLERVQAVLRRLGVTASDEVQLYLVDLLARGSTRSLATPDQPIVQRLLSALEIEARDVRYRELKHTGDAALYTCGFFAEYVEGRGMSRTYYAELGGRAYRGAGQLRPETSPTLNELADNFEAFTDVLDEVREETSLRTPQDIVRLYDRWRKTKSSRLAQRLRKEGVFPQDGEETLH